MKASRNGAIATISGRRSLGLTPSNHGLVIVCSIVGHGGTLSWYPVRAMYTAVDVHRLCAALPVSYGPINRVQISKRIESFSRDGPWPMTFVCLVRVRTYAQVQSVYRKSIISSERAALA